MANLTIGMPDDLVQRLEGIPAARQLALDQLQSLVDTGSGYRPGSPTAVPRAANAAPHPGAADVDDLEAAVASARLPVHVKVKPEWPLSSRLTLLSNPARLLVASPA